MKRVALVGLGLIGGSLALALRERYAELELIACDLPEMLALPAVQGLGATPVPVTDRGELRQALDGVDLAVLATPVQTIVELLPLVLERAEVTTDCGSTKRAIADAARACPRAGSFVPGHPMAGSPRGGIANAKGELFRDETWVLCPEHSEAPALDRVSAVVTALGARICLLDADAHDRAVALTSHVPQLLASALTVLAARRSADCVAGPAFKSATRVAGGPPAMWADIFATNGDAIAEVLAELGAELSHVAAALRSEPSDVSPALEVLAQARDLRTAR